MVKFSEKGMIEVTTARLSLMRAVWPLTAIVASACALAPSTPAPGTEAKLTWRATADQCYADVRGWRLVVYQGPSQRGRGGLVGRAACDRYVEDQEVAESQRQAASSALQPLEALQLEKHEPSVEQRFGRLETDLKQLQERVTEVRPLAEEALWASQRALVRREEGRTQRRLVQSAVVTFTFDQWEIDNRAQTSLLEVVKQLKETPDLVVDLEGHTDAVGSVPYNLQLSQRRAEAVRRFMVEQGVELQRIHTIGFGEAHPVATNRSPDGRAQNRRVTVKIFTLAL